MNVVLDIDGVLADFDTAFRAVLCQVSGRPIPEGRYVPKQWCWAEGELGFSPTQHNEAWEVVKNGPFWATLLPYPGITSWPSFLAARHRVHFLTSRPGDRALELTEEWLRICCDMDDARVIVSGEKGTLCRILHAHVALDDYPENLEAIEEETDGETKTFLWHRAWNAKAVGFRRVKTFEEFIQEAEL